MNIIEKNKINVLEIVQYYDGFYVKLKIKEKKYIDEDDKDIHIFSDSKQIYMVDIIIKNNNKEYLFENYYIGIAVNINNINNIIAKKIIKELHLITFKKSKYIGTIKKYNDDIVIEDDKLVSLSLLKEQDTKYNKNLYNIYNKYNELKKSEDKNMFLKYAAFLEMLFSSHTIPCFIRFEIFKKEKTKQKTIFDYKELDDVLNKELSGSFSKFHSREIEMKKNYNILKELNNELEELANKIRVVEENLIAVNIFLDKIKNNNKINQLKDKYNKLSIFDSKRKEVKKQLSQINKNKKINDKEEHDLINQIINTLNINIDKKININELEELLKKHLKVLKNQHDDKCNKYNNILFIESNYNPNISLEILKEEVNNMSFDELYMYLN